jgi:regulatory protein
LTARQPGGAQERPRDAFGAACRYLTARERCAVEVRAYLRRSGFSAEEIEPAIERLVSERLVDDVRYARLYVEMRSRRSPRSGALLARELMARGIGAETARTAVSEFLTEVPEEELARRLLERLPGSGEAWKRRAARRLVSRGFRASLALRLAGRGAAAGTHDGAGAAGAADADIDEDGRDDIETEED